MINSICAKIAFKEKRVEFGRINHHYHWPIPVDTLPSYYGILKHDFIRCITHTYKSGCLIWSCPSPTINNFYTNACIRNLINNLTITTISKKIHRDKQQYKTAHIHLHHIAVCYKKIRELYTCCPQEVILTAIGENLWLYSKFLFYSYSVEIFLTAEPIHSICIWFCYLVQEGT